MARHRVAQGPRRDPVDRALKLNKRIAMYICLCNAITDRDIVKAAEQGACSSEDLAHELGVGLGCGRCISCAKSILSDALAQRGCAPTAVTS